MLSMAGCGKKQDEVVVYTAVDQVYADEIFEMFEEETGITVKAVLLMWDKEVKEV